MLDHRSARSVFQRAAVAAVDDDELRAALSHAATCDICAEQFEVARTAACGKTEPGLPEAADAIRQEQDLATRLPAVAEHVEGCERCQMILAELVAVPEERHRVPDVRVDPNALFERALTAALSDPDSTVRVRAAERMATARRVGPEALAALAWAAIDDRETQVRAAALKALDRLDEQIAIPANLIAVWSVTSSGAGPIISSILRRLAGGSARAVSELLSSSDPGEQALTIAGEHGIKGDITEEKHELWLTLKGLPPDFEKTKPVVAVPSALEKDAPRFDWSGDKPGLVPAKLPVENGSLKVRLGKGEPAEKERLFRQIYLLKSESRSDTPHAS